ncbi:hypothetical protein [Deinococcus ficus]|uniref:hypothetical protein n=1 Tax=Deinococcus ficus TaxID=317577 RepID=UPI0003B49A6F|nr:hypothetical protein [Deinococcus ficus]
MSLRALTVLLSFSAVSTSALAQTPKTETFDVFTFTAPAGWTRAAPGAGVLRFSRSRDGLYCLFDLYRSARGTGRLDADFQAEWANLVVKPLSPEGEPELDTGPAQNGWQNRLGGAPFTYEGGTSLAVLSTYSHSGAQQAASILMLTNDEGCLNDFDRFLAGVKLGRPAAATPAPAAPPAPAATTANLQPVKSAFTFNTTTFDDGWVSVEQKDWVLSRKGAVTVRLHYPHPALGYEPDSDKLLTRAWNTLVAPRYRDLQGFGQGFDTLNFERPHLAAGTATSVETGQRVYVALFSQAESGWIEVVTPDQATFEREFGLTPAGMYGADRERLNRLRNLRGLNRFAVSAADLKGEWSSSAGGITQWVNSFTGLSAGATGFSSNVTFTFGPGSAYIWNLVMASGVIGAQNVQSARSSGQFSMKGNWQVNFSDIERRPRLYNAYFEAGRGGQRILWLQDTAYGGYSAFVRVK